MRSRVVTATVAIFMFAGALSAYLGPTASATPTFAGGSPPGVPSNYVQTPYGYFDPSCIQGIGASEVAIEDGSSVALVDVTANPEAKDALAQASAVGPNPNPASAGKAKGVADMISSDSVKKARHVPGCKKPHYDKSGHVASDQDPLNTGTSPTASSPTITGWVESANSATYGAMDYLHAQWTVPPAPTSRGSQTVYFFPGFQNTKGTAIIMQPVLAWNQGGSGIAGWSGASWNCCSVGTVFHSAYIAVTGSTISGDVSGNGCNTSTGVCSSWTIVTYDWGSKRSTTFTTTSGGRVMNWTFGGVLEVYRVSSCAQLPGTSVTFSGFYIKDIRNNVRTPAWTRSVTGSLTPACGYSVTVGSANSVVLHY